MGAGSVVTYAARSADEERAKERGAKLREILELVLQVRVRARRLSWQLLYACVVWCVWRGSSMKRTSPSKAKLPWPLRYVMCPRAPVFSASLLFYCGRVERSATNKGTP